MPATRAYAVLAAVLGVAVAVAQPGLLRWVPWFLVPLGVGLWAAAHRQERALLAGLTTVLASALMTVVAYDAGPGRTCGEPRCWPWVSSSTSVARSGTSSR